VVVISSVVLIMVSLAALVRVVWSRSRRSLDLTALAILGVIAGVAVHLLVDVSGEQAAWAAGIVAVPSFFLCTRLTESRNTSRAHDELMSRMAILEAEDSAECARVILSLESRLDQLRDARALESSLDESATPKAALRDEIDYVRGELDRLRSYHQHVTKS
jgi:hypothetical protein